VNFVRGTEKIFIVPGASVLSRYCTWTTSVVKLVFLYLFSVLLLRCHFIQSQSASIGVSMKSRWSVLVRCLYMFTKRRCTAFMTYSLALWAYLVGDRVVCVRGAYCRGGAVVNWYQSVRACHVMRNPSINNETLSQLDVHSTENTHTWHTTLKTLNFGVLRVICQVTIVNTIVMLQCRSQ